MINSINRREWLAASGIAMLTACGRNKGTGFNGYGLVANAGDNSLAAVDLSTFQLSAAIDLKGTPSQIVISQAAQAYTLTPNNGTVHIIDNHLKRVTARRLADNVTQIGLASDGNSLLALAPHAKELIEADLTTLTPRGRHKISIATADSVDFSTTGYAAVASSSGAIELIHLASGQRTRAQTQALSAVRFRADGKVLLAGNLQSRTLLALDVPTLQVIAELPLAMQPDHLCFNYDQGQLFVSGAGMDGVAVVFPYQLLVDQTLLAGRDPGTMACSGAPAYLFVGSSTGSDVCILNIDTRKVVGVVEMGGRPSFIAVTPDGQYALVLDEAAGDMGVIHIPAIHANRLKTGVALFTMLSVGSRPVDLAVLPREA